MVGLVLAGLPARADDELDIPGLDAADLRGDAMLWEDAVIYLEPWENGAAIQRFNYMGRRRDEPGRAMAVRIVDSTLKNFVEIQAPGRYDCSSRKLDADPRIEGLRMFVRREDLAPVLTRPYAMQYSDGTRVKLGIGMPVAPTLYGDYLVGIRDDRVRLPIPHTSVGYIYKAGKIVDPELPKDKLARLDRGASVKLGDGGFTVRNNSWIGPMPDKKTDVALFKIAGRCFELLVEAPANNVRPTEPTRTSPVPPPYPSTVNGWRIRPGTPLSTPSGREVAVAAKDIMVQMPASGPDPVCFEARMAMTRDDYSYGSRNQNFKLCASASAVEK
jgi:hypothetical protein